MSVCLLQLAVVCIHEPDIPPAVGCTQKRHLIPDVVRGLFTVAAETLVLEIHTLILQSGERLSHNCTPSACDCLFCYLAVVLRRPQ